ncbi:hypothetical protein PMAYCL1PPCAC_30469, partial [Pristionchus mayeri]
HPLLMRTAHCTFCMKKLADAYSLSAHIYRCHSTMLHQLKEDVGRPAQVERDGYPIRAMYDPFPFSCSSCNLCWPTAIGIAEHFVNMEKSRKPCGGRLIVRQSPNASCSSRDEQNEISINRYEFVLPVRCPYCTKSFKEAFEMSNHIGKAHATHQLDLERKLEHTISKNPTVKHEYAPFVCTGLKCGLSFKRMEQWSAHYTENIRNRTPCYGEVCIARKANGTKNKNGVCSNFPSQNSGDSSESPIKDELPASAGENPDSCIKKEIKEEPLDEDEAPSTSVPHIPVETPQTDVPSSSTGTNDAIPDALPRPPAATAAESGNAVVKEEPLDEHSEEQAVVKEEPSTSYAGNGKVKMEPGRFMCDKCPVIFTEHDRFMDHIKSHTNGIFLMDSFEPAAKRRRLYGHPATCSFNNDSNTPHSSKSAVFPFVCKHCKKKRFRTLDECKEHEQTCRRISLANARGRAFTDPITCIFCKKGQANVYVLRNHLRMEHGDTIVKLRKHFMMASEFLPFRCSACKVGFEDPRVLLNHFRLREEFGVPCTGNLFLHNYEFSLMEREKLDDTFTVPIPALPITNIKISQNREWCPKDPIPIGDDDDTLTVACPECAEEWPCSQIKLHVKMEHP